MTVTETTRTTEAAIQEFFRCFGGGDWAGVLAVLADDIDWNVPGSPSVPWTGQRGSKPEVEDFLRACATEVSATERFTIDHTIADGGQAVVLGAFTHVIARTGKKFESDFALHVVVTDGLISTYHMFENSHACAEAFSA